MRTVSNIGCLYENFSYFNLERISATLDRGSLELKQGSMQFTMDDEIGFVTYLSNPYCKRNILYIIEPQRCIRWA